MKAKLKSWIINIATGRLLPRIVAAVLLVTATQVMRGWAWFVEAIPGIDAIIDPRLLVDIVSQLIIAIILLAITRATGKPVRELQKLLAAKDVYTGRIDGYAGEQTREAVEDAIDDPTVVIHEPRLVPGKVSASGKF